MTDLTPERLAELERQQMTPEQCAAWRRRCANYASSFGSQHTASGNQCWCYAIAQLLDYAEAFPALLAAARERDALRDENYSDLLDQMCQAWGNADPIGRAELEAFLDSRRVHTPTTALRAQVATLTAECDALRAALLLAYEWAAKYPLSGDGSIDDCEAATAIYRECGPLLETTEGMTDA